WMMDRERAFVVCLMAALLTLTIVIAGCTSSVTSNNTSTVSTRTSENVSMTTKTNATNVTHRQPMTAAQGQNFTITLRSNPSTGYHWEPQFDSTALKLTDSVFVSDPNPHNLVGVPGSQVFTFQGLAKGTTTTTFNNVSPTQIITEQAVYVVTVT
ncbi:MAG: protease inhibitor I42 family protein, partial [Halobacteriota archaeon]